MIKNTFANLYETFVRHPQFSTIVYDSEDYVWIGLFMILIPFLIALVFYKFWDPSPTKIYKWLVFCVLLSVILVFISSYYWIWSGSLEISFINDEIGVNSYALNLSLYNTIFALLICLIWSFIVKRFSINNTNNPL